MVLIDGLICLGCRLDTQAADQESHLQVLLALPAEDALRDFNLGADGLLIVHILAIESASGLINRILNVTRHIICTWNQFQRHFFKILARQPSTEIHSKMKICSQLEPEKGVSHG